jgi:hypothetical protein
MFNPIDYPQALADPLFMTESSVWVGHIPFAWALLEMARPDVLVELGSFRGDSYCAFCQGVAELKLPTRCFAVDTWAGDAQTGSYSEKVLEELRAHHDPRYSGFSTLLRCTFDEARSHFENGSIDVLHIDGLHTYEAVRHDYETWLAKMSPAGVILFHDTATMRSDFGVHRLWAEVAAKFPHFEFQHDSGLGVLGVGNEVPAPVLAFLRLQGRERDLARRYFEVLGSRFRFGRFLMSNRMAAQRAQAVTSRWRQRTGRPPLPPLDPQDFVTASNLLARDLAELVSENEKLRASAKHSEAT